MKVTGSNITITDSVVNKMNILPLGNCEQTGTPTPDNPIDIKVVTGDNQVVVSNSDNTQVQSYTLHLGSLELCKIGDYQDVITGSKDNWKVVRQIGKIVYTGASEENWIYEQNNNGFLILNSLTNLKDLTNYDATKVPDFICNQYIPVSYNSYIAGTIGISERYFNNTDFLRCKSSLTDANAFKTYLSTNNLIVYYPIATPTETPVTDTTLINELNGLQELLSYDGTTNITITSDSNNAQMIVQVTYTSESDMNEKLTNIFNSIKSKLYRIIRAL